jgi:hypothetical protein
LILPFSASSGDSSQRALRSKAFSTPEAGATLSDISIVDWMRTELTTLYRPVGQLEMDRIRGSGFREFPPRLPEQPIFYPVLTEAYATQIAREWNTKDECSGFVGYVLRFQVRTEFLRSYDLHVVGSAVHREYWIPAEDLARFNENIEGEIELVSEFRGGKQGERR